jgi:energy-coupling factor transporter transmembrane protein EcfT
MITIILVIIGLVILNTVTGLIFSDSEKGWRAYLNFISIVLVAFVLCIHFQRYGGFGDGRSLDHKTYYKVLSVTPIDEKSTVVILRDGNGKTSPIEFVTPVKADANGFYTLVGEDSASYNLAPIQ